jgi:hypothetical protein
LGSPRYDASVRFHRRTIVACLFALQLAAATAGARPCAPPVFGESHASLEHAATATLRALFRNGGSYESGGFIIEQGGKFRASKPVTQRSRSDVSYCIVLPRGAVLAGLYHTHVRSAEFSPRDQRNAGRVRVPSFVGTIRGGAVLVYDPQLERVSAIGGKPLQPRVAAVAPQSPAADRLAQKAAYAGWLARAEAALRGIVAFVRRAWNELDG